MIPLARPLLDSEESDAILRVLESGWLVQGERVANFEQLLTDRLGIKHVIACSSGTAALQLAVAALDLPEGSKVAVPSYTFPSPINVTLLAGHRPVLVDVDPSTCNLDEEDLKQTLDDHPDLRAIIAVHQFGLPAPLPTLMPVFRQRDIAVVEDAACALGSFLKIGDEWVPAGAVGSMGCFSFHPRKVITTAEGGALSTADDDLAARVTSLRDHGRGVDPKTGAPEFQRAGWNLRLSEIHAAIGEVQMGRLDRLLQDRARIAAGYNERLAPLEARGLGLPRVPEDVRPNWQTYVIRLPKHLDVPTTLARLAEQGIHASIGAAALHRQPAYRQWADRTLPGTDQCHDSIVALPMPPGLNDQELDQVGEALARLV